MLTKSIQSSFFQLILVMSFFSNVASANSELPEKGFINIFAKIPFSQGADICRFLDGYGKTRDQYVSSMTNEASQLVASNMTGSEALRALVAFNALYDQIQYNAIANNNLGLTLESDLKAFLDTDSRQANAAQRHIRFVEPNSQALATSVRRSLSEVDFAGYGTYALAPSCSGDLQVTFHLVGKNLKSESFVATGPIDSVMSLIANQVYEVFSKTQFPSDVQIGASKITIIGGLNHGIGLITSLKAAELACASRSARLPSPDEIELINAYGDSSGGVTLGEEDDDVYALPGGKVYVPGFKSDPVRNPSEINQKVYKYFCVK